MAVDAKTGQPIFGRYSTGLHNVGSYQVSGWPWVTGSAIGAGKEIKFEFPMVTKSITIIASGSFTATDTAVLRAHFVSTSSTEATDYSTDVITGHHYITFEADDDSITLNVKCKEIYLSAQGAGVGAEIVAELTNVPTDRMFTLTGSGHTEVVA